MQKTALVGYGFMGQMHANAHAALPNSDLAVIVDVEADKRQKAEADHGVATAEKLDEVLSDDSISIIDICLPTYLHCEAAVAALEAGKNVMCEKPMARTPEQCQEMIAAAEKAPGRLMIAQCLRFWPEYARAKGIIDSGELGKVKAVVCKRVSARPTWSWQDWLQKPELSGSALVDLHVHDIDFLVYLLGKPKAVTALGVNRPDTGWDHVLASYDYDGVVAFAEGGWDFPPSFPFRMSFCVNCEGGTVSYDSAASPTLTLSREGADEIEHPDIPTVEAPAGASTGNISDMGGYFLETQYFVNCVEAGKAPAQVPLAETALDIEIAFAEIESATRKQPVVL